MSGRNPEEPILVCNRYAILASRAVRLGAAGEAWVLGSLRTDAAYHGSVGHTDGLATHAVTLYQGRVFSVEPLPRASSVRISPRGR